MKVLIFIEHDVVIRHFVHSGVFAELIAEHDVTFIFPEPGYKRVTMDVSAQRLHWLGPLDDAPLEDGCVRCPWHGYLFDIRTGRSSDGHRLRLAPSPRVTPDGHRLRLVLPG